MKYFALFVFVIVVNFANSQSLYRIYATRSVEYMQQGDYEKAMFYIDKAIKRYPDSVESFSHRGAIHFYQRKYEDALKDFNYCVNNGYSPLHVLRFRGLAYRDSGNYELAEVDLMNVFNRAPIDSAMLAELIGVKYELNEFDTVEVLLAEFNANSRHLQNCYARFGGTEKRHGNYEQGLKHYTKAIELDSNFVEAWIGRAACHMKLENKEEMCKDLHEGFARTYDIRASQIFNNEGCSELTGLFLQPPPQEEIRETLIIPSEEK